MGEQGNGVFTIDGVNLRLWVTELTRKFAVTDSENSGRVKSLLMYRDIIGTFYNYSLSVEPDSRYPEDYDTFFQIVSSPEEKHRVIFPYGQETLEFNAYVTSGEDKPKINKDAPEKKQNEWYGLSIDFIAMEPQRRP